MNFGNLTLKEKKICDFKTILNENSIEIDYLFKNSLDRLNKFSVIESEREIALNNLRTLTNQLQVKRLRYNSKSYCKYFTL